MNDEKLKLLNDKKVEAYNLLRQISNANNQLKAMNQSYNILEKEIIELEREYVKMTREVKETKE